MDKKTDYGSQHWLQILVNQAPHLFDQAFLKSLADKREKTKWRKAPKMKWVSPLPPDFQEYKDSAFLKALDLELPHMPLDQFWPRGGPVWDGLAKSDDEAVFLIEAKAHIPEINTTPTGASEASLDRIQASLEQTREFLNVKNTVDWSKSFYQYTNRLAHLYFLRELNRIDAYLVNLYFINDDIMDGPKSIQEWEGALKLLKSHLGILKTKLSPYMFDVFVDVNAIRDASDDP